MINATLRRAVFVLAACSLPASAATTKFSYITTSGPAGTLTIVQNGLSVDSDWHIDDNGRGSKLQEHAELGADGLPRSIALKGKGWFGAPVKEDFRVEGSKARWTSLDDKGETAAKDAVYVPNNGTPWDYEIFLKALLSAKD